MPNYISVTQRGPDILAPVRSAVGSPIGQEIVGGVRKAGSILKNNPYALVLSELIFPKPFADGTVKGVIKQHGYEAAPSLVFTNAPETYKYEYKPDPDVDQFLKRQKSYTDAGTTGPFAPVR